MIFTWQAAQWQQLWQSKSANRLPHALLFDGIQGTGKKIFADTFTRALLCKQVSAEGVYCNACHDCRLIAGRTHPNVLWIEPEKAGQVIKVDQVRDVTEFVNQSSFQGEYRIVIIHPANNMNMNAANALLKTLEEPSNGAIIILISHQNTLPATIFSRCQRILFPRPNKAAALQWLNTQLSDPAIKSEWLLQLANGAPLAALQLVHTETLSVRRNLFDTLYLLSKKQSDPTAFAAQKEECELVVLLDFVLSWMMDLLKLQLENNPETMVNQDYEKQLTELAQRTDIKHNIKYMEYVQQLRAQICSGLNLNKHLMMENILIRWMEC
jgi:DNA polymerase III subunit delta'